MDDIMLLHSLELIFYFVGISALVIVPVLILISVYLYKKNKKGWSITCLVMTLPFILAFYIALPVYIASYVIQNDKDEDANIHLINFAEKIAVFPADLKSEIVAIPGFKAQLLLRSQRFHSAINDKERNDLINKAVYYYNRACFSKNADTSWCAELSHVYGLLGKYDEAIYVYEKLYLNKDIYARKELIDFYILNKDYEGALKALETQKFNEDIQIFYKAEVYRHMGKYDSALEILNRYIKTHKYKTSALKYRAYVYHDTGKIKQSKSDYMAIVKEQGAKGIYKSYEYFIKNSDIEWLYERIRENEGFRALAKE